MEEIDRGASGRFGRGDKFCREVKEELGQAGFTVAVNSTERTQREIVESLRGSCDPTSLSIRFRPDLIVSFGQPPVSWYVEPKDSCRIEKLALKEYLKLCLTGSVIIIVIKHRNEKRWVFVNELEFLDSDEYVAEFPVPFPVIDGWITPRACEEWRKLKWKNPQASGTPYKVIDPACLREWKELLAYAKKAE